MEFLAWFDDSRLPTPKKIAAACEAYAAKHGRQPSLVLTNINDVCPVPGVEVRSSPYVAKNNFQLGQLGDAKD